MAAVDTKAVATCQARAALLGATLHALEGDAGQPLYIVTCWALTRSFDSLAEVEIWLARVEGGAR